jgi:hypothetical protein
LVRIIKQPLDIALIVIAVVSAAALFLAHEDPFVRDAVCAKIKFCPTITNAKAWNKIFYDLAAGALVSLIFYVLIVRVPDYQRRRRYKKSFAHQYQNFREDCIGLMLGVADRTYEWGKQRDLLDQKKFRAYFDEWVTSDQTRWHRFLNNLDEYNLKEIVKRMEIFRGEIAFILNNVDIPSDEPFEFLKRLSTAIYSMHDKTTGYDDTKSLGGFLWGLFAGFDIITGYRERDIIQEMMEAI